ncbi:glycosyltransferase family 4 protein [Patescibacteria group bacterium]|nr:glycosyltransferase family 4 protein [Patescibacteria group bacterium]
MTKRAAIYDPYLDTLGGGERYCLTVAEILLAEGWQVDLFWSGDKDLLSQATKRFSLEINRLNIIPDIFHLPEKKLELIEENNLHSRTKRPNSLPKKVSEIFNRWQITKQYDLFFYLSDGSIPILFSRKNFLHIQVPFLNQPSILSQLKFNLIKHFVCNSEFTSSFYPYLHSPQKIVLYPPVDVEKFQPNQLKKNTILSLGRFDNILNAKKQDVLIEAFKSLYRNNKNWSLHLAGGSLTEPSNNHYLKHLKYLSQDLPIKISVNPTFEEIIKYYSEATFYWHAAGFGVDEKVHPESTEHFGISVVEAMASGAIPLVVNKGGLPEIIKNDFNGYTWDDIEELVAKTQLLLTSPKLLPQLSKNAVESSQSFSKSAFKEKFIKLVNE